MTKLHYLFLGMDVILFRFWMLFHGGFRNGVLWVCLYLGKNISPFINRKSNKSIIFAVVNCDCACGEIGRRARLRIWCSDTCRFESYQAHRDERGFSFVFFYLFSFEVIYGYVVSLGFVVLFCSSADVMEKERLYSVDRCVLRFIA